MATKSTKLYKDSPSIKKDASGKPGISKPSEADGTAMGVDGDGLENESGSMPVQVMQDRQQKEISDTHKRQETEIKDMHARHAKEHESVMSTDTGGTDKTEIEGTK